MKLGELIMGKFPAIAPPDMAEKMRPGAEFMEGILRRSGLWDAEVLECVVDDTDHAIPTQLLTDERHGLPLAGMGLEHDDRVQVIVVRRAK